MGWQKRVFYKNLLNIRLIKRDRTLVESKNILIDDWARFDNCKPGFKDLILGNERWYIYNFLYHLRCLEYYTNKKS